MPERERDRYIRAAQGANHLIQTMGTPVVAAVNGHAIGAGLELALSADFVVLAVGFGEVGGEGTELEVRLGDAARTCGVRVIGPNTSGMMSLHAGVTSSACVAYAPAALPCWCSREHRARAHERARARTNEGISVCCGLGNQVDIGFDEVLEYLGRDRHTRAVIVHVEGFRDPRAFLRIADGVTPRKPVVVIKSGRTAAGASAVLSHTGAVAGPYDRLRAGLAQAGVTEVLRTDQLVPVAHALASQPPASPGGGIAILSDG